MARQRVITYGVGGSEIPNNITEQYEYEVDDEGNPTEFDDDGNVVQYPVED